VNAFHRPCRPSDVNWSSIVRRGDLPLRYWSSAIDVVELEGV
jgi:hypothetical protein